MKSVLFVLSLFGIGSTAFGYDLVGKTFVHHLVDDEKCDKIRSEEPIFNCTARIEFVSDTKATVLFTDIMNVSTYEFDGATVAIFVEEFGQTLKFALSENKKYLTDESGNIYIDFSGGK
ncbi:MAG: hypothetical protein AB7T49_14165 [Oligoflexales bacterium]